MAVGLSLALQDMRITLVPMVYLFILFLDAQTEAKRTKNVSKLVAWTNVLWVVLMLVGLYFSLGSGIHNYEIDFGGSFQTESLRRTVEFSLLILCSNQFLCDNVIHTISWC